MISIRPFPGRANSAEYGLLLILTSWISEREMRSELGIPSTITVVPPVPTAAGPSSRESAPITSPSIIGRFSSSRGVRRMASTLSLTSVLTRPSGLSTLSVSWNSAIASTMRKGLSARVSTFKRICCVANPGYSRRSSWRPGATASKRNSPRKSVFACKDSRLR